MPDETNRENLELEVDFDLDDPDLEIPELTEEDFERAVRGKYARHLLRRRVELDADVEAVFPTSFAVNQALRTLIRLQKAGSLETAERAAAEPAPADEAGQPDAAENAGAENPGPESADTEDDRRKAS